MWLWPQVNHTLQFWRALARMRPRDNVEHEEDLQKAVDGVCPYGCITPGYDDDGNQDKLSHEYYPFPPPVSLDFEAFEEDTELVLTRQICVLARRPLFA